MYLIIDKDITTVERGIVAHGCNCQGVMGSGVAKAIRSKWPKAYTTYSKHVSERSTDRGANLLGTVQLVEVGDGLFVANLFTQQFYGRDGKKYANIDAIKAALRIAMEVSAGFNLPLYMPLIGCGLGGLSWEHDIEPIVASLSDDIGVDVYVCIPHSA